MLAGSGMFLLGPGLLSGCASVLSPSRSVGAEATDLAQLNRITWGVDSASVREWNRLSRRDYLAAQLHPSAPARLPSTVQAQIEALTLKQKSMPTWVVEMEQRRRDAAAISADEVKKRAQQLYQQGMNRLARDAATQMLLRVLYSPNQLQEQLTWFWFNHFNVHQY
ncbi:MAG: DUF1800 family protein, partial [Ideonella sp.]